MEQLTTATLTQLPQVRALGRHTGRDPLTLFWTASGMELEFTGSELWVDLFADYEAVEPWVSVELNGAWVARFAVNPGKSRICLFRGMTPGKAKHLRLLKDVQAMHDDPAHLLQITGLEYAGGEFLPLPEPQYRLEFVGDSITSGEGAIGAKPEEDWVGAFFSAENHYGRLTADALGAEYRCISQSGWGLVTGWDNDVRHVMPPYYTQVCGVAMGQRNAALGAQQDNDFAAWKPDAVIVNLGTNDTGAFDNPPWQDPATGKTHQMRRLSNGDFHPADAQKVANGVQHFLTLLRAKNPGAKLVWCIGMLGSELLPVLRQGSSAMPCRNRYADRRCPRPPYRGRSRGSPRSTRNGAYSGRSDRSHPYRPDKASPAGSARWRRPSGSGCRNRPPRMRRSCRIRDGCKSHTS